MQRQVETGFFRNSHSLDIKYRLMLPESDEPVPLVVVIPGFGGSDISDYVTKTMQALIDQGFASCCLNLTSRKADGRMETKYLIPSISRQVIRDGLAFIKQDKRIDPQQIIVYAMSYGAYSMTTYLAEHQDDSIKALILTSAVPFPLKPFEKELAELSRVEKWLWERKGHVTRQFQGDDCDIAYGLISECLVTDLVQKAKTISTPVMIVHGSEDELTSVDDIQKLKSGFSISDICLINGADHAMTNKSHLREAVEHSIGFIKKFFHVGKQETVELPPAFVMVPSGNAQGSGVHHGPGFRHPEN